MPMGVRAIDQVAARLARRAQLPEKVGKTWTPKWIARATRTLTQFDILITRETEPPDEMESPI